MDYNNTPKTIHENYGPNGELISRIDVIDNRKKPIKKEKNYLIVKKPLLVIGCSLLTAIGIVLIAALVLSFWQRAALYKESCHKRSCLNELNMKCLNGTCLCTTDQYYSKK